MMLDFSFTTDVRSVIEDESEFTVSWFFVSVSSMFLLLVFII